MQSNDKKGIFVDENFETTEKNIFAIGDVVNGNIMLAHKAMFDGEILANNLLNLGSKHNSRYIPSCIYITPEIACGGLTTTDCENEDLEYSHAPWNKLNLA